MKLKFIFLILISNVLWSCKTTELPEESTFHQPFNVIVQHWFTNPNLDSNYTERGIDITLKFHDINRHEDDSTLTPEYVIFNERKSFPPMITLTEKNTLRIEARIILESSLFQQVSVSVNQTNRLALTNSDGDEIYLEFREWEALPNRYH